MRYLIAILMLFAAAATVAEPGNPRGIVFAYECKHIDQNITGFSCHFDDGALTLQLHRKKSEMSADQNERAEYEFNKIAMRYFELGGSGFDVKADFWNNDKHRYCARSSKQPYYVFGCGDVVSK